MWKYECKKHLVYVLIGMAVGALLFGTFAFQREILMASANEAIAMLHSLDVENEFLEKLLKELIHREK